MHTSVVGSKGHMAPEMVDEKRPGYSWQVDWWSLGVCFFELLWNQYPFVGGTEEELRDDIMTLPITIPSQSHGTLSSECTAALLGVSRDGGGQMVTLLMLGWILASRTRPEEAVGLQNGLLEH